MHPWIVGWIASDGHNRGDIWTISQNIDDSDALYIIRDLVKGTKLRIEREQKDRFGTKPMVIIWNNSSETCRNLVQQGIPIGEKTTTVRFPNCLSDRDMWMYVRGVFEGDGSVGMDEDGHPRIEITISRAWCDSCEAWLAQHNINSYVIDERRSDGVANLVIHNVDGARKFLEEIYRHDRDLRMGRKFSLAAKTLLMIEYGDVLARKSMTKAKREKTVEVIRELVKCGKSAAEISRKLDCPLSLAGKVARQEIGSMAIRLDAKMTEAGNLLRDGMSRGEVRKRLNLGYALVNRAFERVFGDIKTFIRKKQLEKTAEIRRMILGGFTVEEIRKKVRCGLGRVISEKRKMAAEGLTVKLNKRRNPRAQLA